MYNRLVKPFLSARFLKFGAVGVSGIAVNLSVLWMLHSAGLVSSAASAIAIEVSIATNFLFNDFWTFADRSRADGILIRGLRFQAISLVGAAIQWLTFIVSNVAIFWIVASTSTFESWLQDPAAPGYLRGSVLNPPDVGRWIYISQLAGIAVATAWNFLGNFYWTWKRADQVGR